MAGTADSAAFQVALARILVEPTVRERFLADPRSVGRELGLGDEQVGALMSAGLAELESFAHSLQSKRLSLLAKVCQATYRLLERHGALPAVARSFFREHPPVRSEEHANRTLRDGFWLIDVALGMAERGEIDCPHLADVGRFERIMLRLSSDADTVASADAFEAARAAWPEPSPDEVLAARPRTGAHSVVERFDGPVVDVVGRLARGEALDAAPAPSADGVTILFTKAPGWRNVRTIGIGGRTRRLVELCDGSRTTREVAAVLRRESLYGEEPEEMAAGCAETVLRLYSLNVVCFDRTACASAP